MVIFRNAELVKESLEKTITINEYKHRNAKLEKQVEKLSIKQNGSQAVRARGGSSLSPSSSKPDDFGDVMELETKYVFLLRCGAVAEWLRRSTHILLVRGFEG